MSSSPSSTLFRRIGYALLVIFHPVLAAKFSYEYRHDDDSSKWIVFALFSVLSAAALAFMVLSAREAWIAKDLQSLIAAVLALIVYCFFAWQMLLYKHRPETNGDSMPRLH